MNSNTKNLFGFLQIIGLVILAISFYVIYVYLGNLSQNLIYEFEKLFNITCYQLPNNSYYSLQEIFLVDKIINFLCSYELSTIFIFLFYIFNQFYFILLFLAVVLIKNNKLVNLVFIIFNVNFFILSFLVYKLNIYFPEVLFVGENPVEMKFDLAILLLFPMYKNKNNELLTLLILIFFIFFKPSLVGICLLVLIFKFKDKKLLENPYKYFYLALPIIHEIFRFIYSSSAKLNFFWLSLIHDPYSGLSRYPDLWLTLAPLKCKSENTEITFLFSESIKDCENFLGIFDSYSPLLSLLNLKLNLWFTIISIGFIFTLFYIFLYLYLLRKFQNQNIIVLALFLSPAVNFLFYTGNFDILTMFFASILIINYEKSPLLFSFLLLLISLIEIHSIGIIFGLLIYGIFYKNKKISIINFLNLSTFTYILYSSGYFLKLKEFFFKQNSFDLNTYTANPGAAYGVLNDFSYFINKGNINSILFIFIFFFVITFSFIPFLKSDKRLLQFESKNFLENKLSIYCLGIWYIFILVFTNQSYRIANFLILIILLASETKFLFKLIFIFSFLFTPASIIFSDFFFYIQILLNRTGIYIILYFLLLFFVYEMKDRYQKN